MTADVSHQSTGDGFLLPHGPIGEGDLDTRLHKHAEYYDMMVDLIPPEFYIHKENPEDDDAWKRYKKGANKQAAAKQAVKENTKKAKKLKYAESGEKTTTGLQKEEAEKQQQQQQQQKNKIPQNATTSRAKSLEELRERLRSKIEERKQARTSSMSTGTDARKRKRGQSSGNMKNQKVDTPNHKEDAFGSKKRKVASNQGEPETEQQLRENLSYGVFKVGDEKKIEAVSAALGKKHNKGMTNKKNLKTLLAKAEDNQKQLQKSSEANKKVQWEAAIKRAEGEKVLDDPKLLRRSLKRKEKAKQKSRKQWKEREDATKKKTAAKQEKREGNLKQRKHKSSKNSRPGFEGTNTKILNK